MKYKKRMAKLAARIRDYDMMLGSKWHEGKVSMRINSGGYHKPGSNRK